MELAIANYNALIRALKLPTYEETASAQVTRQAINRYQQRRNNLDGQLGLERITRSTQRKSPAPVGSDAGRGAHQSHGPLSAIAEHAW
jgi:hypothetical protein